MAAETLRLQEAILALQDEQEIMTVRGIFYALVGKGIIPKDQNRGYRPVQRNVLELRRRGELPWSFVADTTRWQRKPETWDDAEDALQATSRAYRRNLWRGQGLRVEVWLEKDALAGVIAKTTETWDVSLMISRGVSSATFLHSAVEVANDAWRTATIETMIVTLFDFDAGGARARSAIQRHFEENAWGQVSFDHVAVTEAQIADWDLPTRLATKTDPEAKKWGDIAVELDAIPTDRLRGLVEDAITRRIDAHAWNLAKAYEESERDYLQRFVDGYEAIT